MTDRLLQDVRYALRQMRLAPGFTVAVIATLALAIGANTALFSLVNALVLRTMPVRDPRSIVLLQASDDRAQQNRPIYFTTFTELAKVPAFESVALYSGGGLFQIQVRGTLNEGLIEASTPGLFETLGLRPYLGRFFTPQDAAENSGADAVAVISYDFWTRAFGGDPKAIGERMVIDTVPVDVIGVTPSEYKGFYGDGGYGFSVPLTFLNREIGTDPKRALRGLNAVGRLARGVSIGQARAATETAWSTLRTATMPANVPIAEQKELPTQRIKVTSLATGFSGLRDQYERPLMLLSGITATLLLIGCVNLSGLFLARTAAREQQLAIRFALGASRRQIVQQLIVESLLLSAAGAALAIPLAWWITQAASALLWQGTGSLVRPLSPDRWVLTMTVLVSLATGLAIGVLPAWTASRKRARTGLRPDRTVARASSTLGRVLLAAQVAMSLVLLVGAGLFASSLGNLRAQDLGVRADGLRWARLFGVPGGYRTQDDASYYPVLVQRLSEVPGVSSVAMSTYFPTFYGMERFIRTQRMALSESDPVAEGVDGVIDTVSPRFFETLGVPVIDGREFTWADDGNHPQVVIINEALRRTLFSNGNAIGRRIAIGNDPRRGALEIVGVVRDAAIVSNRRPDLPMAFRPRMQELPARAPAVTVRFAGDPVVVDAALIKAIDDLRHEYTRRFSSVDEQVSKSLLNEQLLAMLSSFCAALAAILAFVGLYGALAYAVSARTREMGVRLALGASPARLIQLVVNEGVVVTVAGIAVGIPVALGAGGLIRSFLFELVPSDPTTLIAAAVFFVVVGAVAGVVPALRASTVDPVTVLRGD